MKKSSLLVALFFLISCGDLLESKNSKPSIDLELPKLQFDYNFPDKNIPIEIYEFKKLDFDIDLS